MLLDAITQWAAGLGLIVGVAVVMFLFLWLWHGEDTRADIIRGGLGFVLVVGSIVGGLTYGLWLLGGLVR